MSDFDDAVADMDGELFDTDAGFAVDATYTPAATGTPLADPVPVIIDQDVTRYLWEGVDTSDADVLVSIRRTDAVGARDDLAVVASGPHAGTYRLTRRAAADPWLIRYFARKIA